MRAHVSMLVLFVAACSSGSPTPRERASERAPQSRVEARAARYALHEWGLLGAVLDAPGDAPLALGTGPIASGQRADLGATRTRPAFDGSGTRGLGLVGTGLGGGKPVIYVKLLDGEPVRFALRVSVPGGRFLEHFPDGAIERNGSGESLVWNVEARTRETRGRRASRRSMPRALACRRRCSRATWATRCGPSTS